MPETKNYCQRVREVIRLRPLTRSTSRNGTTQNDTFGYNPRSELTSATLGNANYAYAFDNIGNRETSSETGTALAYTANNLNQYTEVLSSESSASFAFNPSYDADGNATLIQTSTGTWSITYNGANRPVRFCNEETDTTVDCGYDSQGRRYFKKVTVAGTVTLHHRYIYRGYLQIACVDCTRSGHPALWLVTWDPSQPTATRPLAIQKDGTWFTYGYDLTKNVCEVFGPAGYIRTAYSYAPFGNVTASGDVTQPFQWSSEHYDSELDLVYYNFRHYSPSLGRFLSRDPIAEQGGRNLYAFVQNNPILLTDEKGESWSSLAPPGLCAYAATKMPDMTLPCCNGEFYDTETYCCKNIENKEVLIERKKSIVLYQVSLYGRMGIPMLLQHSWLEGDFIPKKSAGLYPDGIHSSDDYEKKYPVWGAGMPTFIPLHPLAGPYQNMKTKKRVPIILDTCKNDLDKFRQCILHGISSASADDYFVGGYCLGRNCATWASELIVRCKTSTQR